MIAVVKSGHWATAHTEDFQLESLRKSDVVRAAYSPEYECAVLIARARGGKERLLGMWTDAFHTGTAVIADLIRTGAGLDLRSVKVWF